MEQHKKDLNYSSSTSSNCTIGTNNFTIKYKIDCNDDYYLIMPIDENLSYYRIKIILAPWTIGKTRFIKDVEEKLEDYIYDLDKSFIKDNGSYMYDIIQEKAYDLSRVMLNQFAEEEDYILDERYIDKIIDEVIKLIDFEELYEIIDDIMNNSSSSIESKLQDIGMSISDFI